MRPQIVLDYETRSEADLKKLGGVEYSKHPSTEIICVGYKIGDAPAKLWLPHQDPMPKDFLKCARDENYIWVAHNALFEQCVTENVLRREFKDFPHMPPRRWKDTAAKAAACALPRNLEGACLALDLPVKKNMDGRKLMLKHSKPRRAWLKWKAAPLDEEPEKYFETEIERWAIYDYCKTDVEAEYLLDKRLPDLIPFENEIWILNQEMNLRGVKIDVKTAKLILKLIATHSKILTDEIKEITNGAVTSPGQRDRILEWLEDEGLALPNLAAATVTETLAALQKERHGVSENAKRLLEIRQALAKSSTKKYQAMITRAGADERVRDLALYHGASTGREAGTGLQLHNLPKGKIKNTDAAICEIQTGDAAWVECIYGDLMGVFSACIRGMITATKGYKLFVADFNAIECRILNWIAGQEDILKMFREGIDLYVKMASRVNSDDRQLGKTIELACGYQMGADRLFQTCIAWGVNGGEGISQELAVLGIKAYRESHPHVVKLWSTAEKAAIAAVRNPGKIIHHNMVAWGMSGGFLWCRLPSGRKLWYYGPSVRNEAAPWGELRPKLYHWGVNPLTKKWECAATYGGKLVENIVQAIGRDLTMYAAVKMSHKSYTYLFQVHDELISESPRGSVKEFEDILMDLPEWAKGLPIMAKGWSGERYKKG